MKKRMLYICSLGLITAAMLNVDMRNDGALLVQAEGNTVENLFAGDSPENGEFSDSSELFGHGETEIQGVDGSENLFGSGDGNVNTEADGISPEGGFEIDVYLDEEVLSVPLEKMNLLREEEAISPEPYGNRYIFLLDSKGLEHWSLQFSQTVDAGDVLLYHYDAENRMARERIGADEISMTSDGTFLINPDGNAEYVIVLEHADQYPGIETRIRKTESEQIAEEQMPEAAVVKEETQENNELVAELAKPEAENEAESEPEPEPEEAGEVEGEPEPEEGGEAEGEPETELEEADEVDGEPEPEETGEVESEPEPEEAGEEESESEPEEVGEVENEPELEESGEAENELVTEGLNEVEGEPVTETGTDTEMSVSLESVELVLDDGLEMIPAALVPYLEDGEGAKALLRYSDGSEQILSGESDFYGNSIGLTYEDTVEDDGSVSRTYTLEVVPVQSEDCPVKTESETVVFHQQAGETIDDIKAQEKTKVRFSGKKSWLLVQSVPQVTGNYSLQSFGRDFKELYYLADGEKEAAKAEDVFELQQGVMYTFLLILE